MPPSPVPKSSSPTRSVREIPDSVRVGSVPYLNAKPLTHFISSPIAKVEPSQLAQDLRAGELDVALVPIMEVLQSPTNTYRIVDKLAIGSEREVYSVYLNYSVPLAKVQTVALDPASKTSVELARLVLEKFHRLKPRYVSTDEPADAQLLIGDPAINHRQAHPEQNYLRSRHGLARVHRASLRLRRLGHARQRHQHLAADLFPPDRRSVPDLLRRAGKQGLAWRDTIARNPFERKYLTDHLCYDLGARQKKAITLFGEMLTQSGRSPPSQK